MQSKLSNTAVSDALKAEFGAAILSSETPYDFLTVEVESSKIHAVITWLKQKESLDISFLTNIGGVHYPDQTEREFAVVYHLQSMFNNFRIRLKTYVPLQNPEIDSIVDIYAGANWMERETFDFYGILFKGHPNLIRILNEDSMDYHPMRKEYHLEDATREDKDDRFFGR
jgi:NADH-quinone oxidoreductase subunit C